MYEQIGFLRLNSEKQGKSSPEQNRHIYTKILQNSSSNILSARTSKTNSKTPYELNILQDQKPRNDKATTNSGENPTEKDFKSIYSSNQLTSSIDLKGMNFKGLQDNSNTTNVSNDNSRNMRKSLENLNIYTKSKPVEKGDKYNELKQSIMNQIKMQNFKEGDEKNSSRDNSKQHSSNSNLIATHKSALNYFSLNQNNKNIKSVGNNQNNNSAGSVVIPEKPPVMNSNKTFRKVTGQFENAVSPDKKLANAKTNHNSIKKDKKPLDNNNALNQNPTHLHSNKNNVKYLEKYYETLEKSSRKMNLAKTSSYTSKEMGSNSFQQNQSKSKNNDNLNISDNSQISANNNRNLENPIEKTPENVFDFTLLKSYNHKLSRGSQIENNEHKDNYLRDNIRKEIRDTPPKKRELAKSLPATTKNSNNVNFKGNLNEVVLNNKGYNLLKTRREEESKEINNQNCFKGNVKVNDLLNEEFKSNSEKLVKGEKGKCEDCEIKLTELENIYEKVRVLFDTHRKKEANWVVEKTYYLKQIEYLNSVIKQFIEKTS